MVWKGDILDGNYRLERNTPEALNGPLLASMRQGGMNVQFSALPGNPALDQSFAISMAGPGSVAAPQPEAPAPQLKANNTYSLS